MSAGWTAATAKRWEDVMSTTPDIEAAAIREDAEKALPGPFPTTPISTPLHPYPHFPSMLQLAGDLGVHNVLLREGQLESCSQASGCDSRVPNESPTPDSFLRGLQGISRRLFPTADRQG